MAAHVTAAFHVATAHFLFRRFPCPPPCLPAENAEPAPAVNANVIAATIVHRDFEFVTIIELPLLNFRITHAHCDTRNSLFNRLDFDRTKRQQAAGKSGREAWGAMVGWIRSLYKMSDTLDDRICPTKNNMSAQFADHE
jgi:hypothetical protein